MSLFEFIKSEVSILDVVAEHVQLKVAGSYWKGTCPFHTETDASFTVSPEKQIFYCFGCHATGDVIAFIAKIENLSQIEAVKFLIDRYNISVPPELTKTTKTMFDSAIQGSSYFDICKCVAIWLHKQLYNNPLAFNYLKNRGVSDESIKKFMLGYFPGGLGKVNKFVKEMANQGILVKDLLEHGILMEGRSFFYSPFEERVIFPIKDQRGRFCGFGGRIFKVNDERPKYYNSKESDGFIKGKLLFALDLAKRVMQEKKIGFLVEGYLDCITMFQYGYKNVVATLGTACTVDHLKVLSRYIKELFVVYDGDKAGQNAILRLAEFCWMVKMDLKVVLLPTRHDPASLLFSGENLEKYVSNAKNIFNFFIESVGGNFQQKTLADKMVLAERIIAVIARLDDSFKRDLILAQAAVEMGVPFDSLKMLLNRYRYKKFDCKVDEDLEKECIGKECDDLNEQREINLLEEKIFSAIINSEDRTNGIKIDRDLWPYFSNYIQTLLKKLDEFLQSHEKISYKSFFSNFLYSLDQKDRDWVMRVSMRYGAIQKETFNLLLLRFCKVNWKQIVQGIKVEILKAKQLNDVTRLNNLLLKFLKLREGIQEKGLI